MPPGSELSQSSRFYASKGLQNQTHKHSECKELNRCSCQLSESLMYHMIREPLKEAAVLNGISQAYPAREPKLLLKRPPY